MLGIGSQTRATVAAKPAAPEPSARSLTITPNEAARHGLALNRDGHRRSAFELLAYPEVEWTAQVRSHPVLGRRPRIRLPAEVNNPQRPVV